jgi:CubicO group peptidase (beta-lactamase class C family)
MFDAGSLQKQFVAAAVLLLVEERRLSLSDDDRKRIPELPDYGPTITVEHLLSDTSGVRDWTGIAPFAAGNPVALTITLRQRGFNFESARSRTYRDNLRDVVNNRAVASEKRGGRWTVAMPLDNDRGGGALLSTSRDLLIWNEALTSGGLGAFVTEKLKEQARLNNGREVGYPRGHFLDTYRGGTDVWHTGGAAGYKSWLGRYPEHGLSIAILCNSGDDTNSTIFAHRNLDLFVPATAAASAEAKAPAAIGGGADAAGVELSSKGGAVSSASAPASRCA